MSDCVSYYEEYWFRVGRNLHPISSYYLGINLEFFKLQEEAERKRMEALQRKHENRLAHDEEMKALLGKAAGPSKVFLSQ